MTQDDDKIQSILHAYIDRQLSPSAREKFERHLEQHPSVREQLVLQQRLKQRLQETLKQSSVEQQAVNRLQQLVQDFNTEDTAATTPDEVHSVEFLSDELEDLIEDVMEDQFTPMYSASPQIINTIKLAAVLVLGIGIGLFFGFGLTNDGATNIEQLAIDAHTIYAAEQAHAVEVPASENAQMMKWLSARLTVSVGPADLEGVGWKLMGGRLLPSAGKHAAFYHYKDEQGKRLSLYIRQRENSSDRSSCEQVGKVNYCEWTGKKLVYLLVSELPEKQLSIVQRTAEAQLSK